MVHKTQTDLSDVSDLSDHHQCFFVVKSQSLSVTETTSIKKKWASIKSKFINEFDAHLSVFLWMAKLL